MKSRKALGQAVFFSQRLGRVQLPNPFNCCNTVFFVLFIVTCNS